MIYHISTCSWSPLCTTSFPWNNSFHCSLTVKFFYEFFLTKSFSIASCLVLLRFIREMSLVLVEVISGSGKLTSLHRVLLVNLLLYVWSFHMRVRFQHFFLMKKMKADLFCRKGLISPAIQLLSPLWIHPRASTCHTKLCSRSTP